MKSQNSYSARRERDLNDEQMEAVTAPGGPVLVVAGPGSGKTRVVTYRILHLVEKAGVHPGRILAMTFTNKAAGEMKQRLGKFLGSDVRQIWVGTFHATCARLLRIHHAEAGISQRFNIIDEEDQIRILKSIMKEHFPGRRLPKASYVRHLIETAKRSSITWDKFSDRGRDRAVIKKIYEHYEAYLREHDALDFGDLIFRTVDMLEKRKDVRDKISDRFIHVLVDEFQDTDVLQYKLVRLLSEKHGNLFVVGDEDQSIYGWRGAKMENMLNFRRDYGGCSVVKLQKNYRSTLKILNAAMAVISCNEERTEKNLWTDADEGAPVRHLRCGSERDEAGVIAREIAQFVTSGGTYGGCAVIYRIHAQSRAIEEGMIEQGIPYRIVGGVRFFERMEIKDLIGYLKLSANPDDDISFIRVLNVPPRGFGEETLRRIRQAAAENSTSLFSVIKELVDKKVLPARKLGDLKNFASMMEEFHRRSKELLPSELLEEIMKKTAYGDYLKNSFPENYETRRENVRELEGFMEEFEEENPDTSLNALFDRVALYTSVDTMNMQEDKVTLMTAHSAKGLEFDAVHVAGVEDGLFPYRHPSLYEMSEREYKKEIEEECRLLYVAMTRAKQKLVLTSAASRRLFSSSGGYQLESPFLEDVDDDVIERSDAEVEEELEDDELEADGIRVGDRVKHKTFGSGKVIGITPGDLNKVTVRFKNGRVKQIIETFLERT